MSARAWGVALLALALAAGCSRGGEKPASTLSEAQRDSVLAKEPIPGASAVGRAQQAAAHESGHTAGLDTLAH